MSLHQRLCLLKEQKRSYLYGTIECINDQWVFFDDESEEAIPLETWFDDIVEVFISDEWKIGMLEENGSVLIAKKPYFLSDGEQMRVQKSFPIAFEEFLFQLDEEAFIYFANQLNALNFSVYDVVYCYNHMSFSGDELGVSFISFDNLDEICLLQHHFVRGNQNKDRFEFTLSTGKRVICSTIEK